MDSHLSNYQVIARKYRPQTFAHVVGQEAIVTTLKNALRLQRLAHAYLFCGCRGTGKTTLARVFAKALNCSCPTPDFEPCNACPSCLDINAGRSLDVLEIDGASNRGIDDIRQINETIGYAPASGKYKIYIIDEVHMLTKEAFNALLKTLEEPPPNVKFFFATTEPHKVLPTIISRCQRFDLNRIPLEVLKGKLARIAQDLNIPCEEEVFSSIASLSEGSLRDAESLLDQIFCYAEPPITAAKISSALGLMPRSVFFTLDKAFAQQDLSYAFELAEEIFSSGKDLSYFIDNLIEHYRCLLKHKLQGQVVLPTAKLKEQYSSSSALYTEDQCLYILDFLMHWQQQIGKTPFKRVSLEMILLHILRCKSRVTLPALVKRLIELEQKLYGAQEDLVNLESARQSQIDPKEEHHSRIEKGEDEDRFGKVAATPNSPKLTERRIPTKQSEHMPIEASSATEKIANNPSLELEQKATTEPLNISTTEKIAESLSLEEALLKKIKEKIEAAPPSLAEEVPILKEAHDLSPSPPSLVLSRSQWEAASTKATAQPELSAPLQESSSPSIPQSRYDTLIRFAAVELEGIVKNT